MYISLICYNNHITQKLLFLQKKNGSSELQYNWASKIEKKNEKRKFCFKNQLYQSIINQIAVKGLFL